MEKNLKREMREVCTRMNEDEELKVRYYDFLEETKALNEAIIRDEKRKARKEGLEEGREEGRTDGRTQGLKEIVINMYSKNMDINLIQEATNLSLNEIKKIIKEKK